MDKQAYIEIRSQLDFRKPLWVTLAVMAADAGLLVLCLAMATSGSTALFILSQFLLALFYFHNFGLLHEAGHGNISTSRRANTIVGHITSIFCFLPYYPWKYIHAEHHYWTGNIDKDPTMKGLRKFRDGGVPWYAALAWRYWLPVPAFMQHFVLWFYPLTMWREGTLDRRKFINSSFSVLWLITAYTALFTLLPQWFNLSNLWLSFLIYLVVVELVNFPHHLKMRIMTNDDAITHLPLWQQYANTRSCYYPYFLSELLTLNFNLHTEHHFFPTLPWYRLKKARALIKPAMGGKYQELVGIGWNMENRKLPASEVFIPPSDKKLWEMV